VTGEFPERGARDFRLLWVSLELEPGPYESVPEIMPQDEEKGT
jgi:hypothetical protein